jgi:glycine cleavage system H protein
MAENPTDRKYTEDHEWVLEDATEEHVITIGITHFAQDALGDIVMVELPEVGDMLTTGEPLGAVESPKSVSDVFSPVTGEVVAVNEELEDAPEQVNDSPFSEGWLVRVRLEKPEEIAGLMNASAYTSFCEAEDH